MGQLIFASLNMRPAYVGELDSGPMFQFLPWTKQTEEHLFPSIERHTGAKPDRPIGLQVASLAHYRQEILNKIQPAQFK